MPVYYNADKKTWYTTFYAKDYKGINKKYKKTGFKKKKDAQQYEYEFKLKISKSMNMTLNSLYEIYFDDYKKRYKPTTVNTTQTLFNTHILPFFGEMELCKVTPFVIREWQNKILEKTNNNKKLSENTKSSLFSALKSLFSWAVKYQGLNENPCKNLGSFGAKKNQNEMNIWSFEEFDIFINKLSEFGKKYFVEAMAFKTLFWTGMRVGELMALTFGDIDLESKTININKTFSKVKGKVYITSPKTLGSKRKILIPEILLNDLKYYFENFDIVSTKRIFEIKTARLRYILTKFTNVLGLKRIRIHDFRHSHASYLLFLKADITAISKRLGHDNLQTTINTYSHLYKDANAQLIDKINNIKIK